MRRECDEEKKYCTRDNDLDQQFRDVPNVEVADHLTPPASDRHRITNQLLTIIYFPRVNIGEQSLEAQRARFVIDAGTRMQ
jgi:hypothetical protein